MGGGNKDAYTLLTPEGEAVLTLLWALHRLNPALSLSNRVVMPDHLHYLLIVDYDRDPTFDPLVFVHWFQRESERKVAESRLSGNPTLPVFLPTVPPWRLQ